MSYSIFRVLTSWFDAFCQLLFPTLKFKETAGLDPLAEQITEISDRGLSRCDFKKSSALLMDSFNCGLASENYMRNIILVGNNSLHKSIEIRIININIIILLHKYTQYGAKYL